MKGSTRLRRSPEEARRLILEAAEQLLIGGGVNAVSVRAVAARMGLTDAAIAHHFGGRDGLLEALLRHGGRKLRAQIEHVLAAWTTSDADIGALVDALAHLHESGYAELALGLHLAGRRDSGSGFLNGVVDSLHERRRAAAKAESRKAPAKRDTRLAVAAVHQAMFNEALFGESFRRSAGLDSEDAAGRRAMRRWWTTTLCRALDLPAEVRR